MDEESVAAAMILSLTESLQSCKDELASCQSELLTEDWRAREDWVAENGLPNLNFFATHFGKSRVQVADCDRREYTDQKRLEMSVL